VRIEPLLPSDWEARCKVASDPLVREQPPQPERWREPVFRTFFDEAVASGGAARLALRGASWAGRASS
jgi:hypothetical protein